LKTVNALIVDDEALARLNIREALKDYSHWKLVAELSSTKHLITTVNTHQVDIIFLDINMPGENGINAARKLALTDTNTPHIVFVTAFDDYAVQAFELYALDYLLKPFDTERFEQCISKAEKFITREQTESSNYRKFLNKEYLDRIVIKSTASIRVIDVEDIFWLGTNGNYVDINHTQGRHLYRSSLSTLLDFLDPTVFCRVHRQVVVRVSQARELKSTSDNKNTLLLVNGDCVSVSERYKNIFLKNWAG